MKNSILHLLGLCLLSGYFWLMLYAMVNHHVWLGIGLGVVGYAYFIYFNEED